MRLKKRVARLVENAKSELDAGSRNTALDLMKEAVRFDGNKGLVIQAILAIERTRTPATPSAPEEEISVGITTRRERNDSMASQDRLTELFASSDSAYEQGDQAGAINFLKQARKLAPDSKDATMRMALLRRRIKSANLVRIGRRELENGNPEKAVIIAREAFDLLPQAEGLKELLNEIESTGGLEGNHSADTSEPEQTPDAPGYIVEIRELVQENELEKAASRAQSMLESHPADELLLRFVEKFRKMGLLKN